MLFAYVAAMLNKVWALTFTLKNSDNGKEDPFRICFLIRVIGLEFINIMLNHLPSFAHENKKV